MKKKIVVLFVCSVLLSACKEKTIPVSSVTIEDDCTIYMGEIYTIQSDILPRNATDKIGSWASSDEAVARVKYQGEVTGIREGIASITATFGGVKSNICTVTVLYRDVFLTSITIDQSMVVVEGDKIAITPVLFPDYATNKDLTWSSSDESVVTVDADGNMIAIKAGTTEITAVSETCESNKCVVTVLKNIPIHIPDVAFKNYLLNKFDANKNGILSQKEALHIEEIELDRNVKSLEGIRYFPFLKYLDCRSNSLTELDLSNNSAIETVYCDENKLSKLNLSNAPSLTILYCNDNNLSELDLSKSPLLETLHCEQNILSGLTLTNNAKLVNLVCNDNPLKSLNIRENKSLVYLDCSNVSLTYLSLSENYYLETLFCHDNQLTSLDINRNSNLIEVNANNNRLYEFEQTWGIKYLWLDNNKLTSIKVRNSVVELHCANNNLTGTLDVSSNENLKELLCSGNKLEQILINKDAEIWIDKDLETIVVPQ